MSAHRDTRSTEEKGQKMNPRLRYATLAAALVLGLAVGQPIPASAGGGHGYYGHGYYGRGYYGGGRVVVRPGYYPRYGVFIGSPYPYYPYAYPYWGSPYPYYPPAVVAVPSSPPVYIEKGAGSNEAPAQNDAQAYWYFCAGSNAYYPYVKQCPGGWERQVPMPPPDAR